MKRHLILFLTAAAACSSAAAPDRNDPTASTSETPARVVDTLEIRLGQSATFDGGRLEIRFETVVGDSRCPANAVCVWQGDAHVKIVTRVAGGAPVTSSLHSTLEPHKVTVDRYTISMVGLLPYPGTVRDTDTPPTPTLILRVASE
jgi:hypothetical protein